MMEHIKFPKYANKVEIKDNLTELVGGSTLNESYKEDKKQDYLELY